MRKKCIKDLKSRKASGVETKLNHEQKQKLKEYHPERLALACRLNINHVIYKKHFEGSAKNKNLVLAMEHMWSKIQGRNIISIWDQARTHKSKVAQIYFRQHPEIYIEELPAYAPQLNPEEYCHGNVKQHLKNACPKTKKIFVPC